MGSVVGSMSRPRLPRPQIAADNRQKPMKLRAPTIVEVLAIVVNIAVVVALLQPATGTLSPYLVAVSRGDVAEVRRLIDSGRADPNERGHHGRRPLHYAAYRDREDVAKLLLEKGAEINTADRFGETPLHAAAFFGSLNVVRLLVDRGANINVEVSGGRTPLDCAEEALQRIAESDKNNRNQQPQIADAERRKYSDIIKFLIDKGAKRKQTPKHQSN
jgi:ankyrin repeat protein